MINVFFVPGMFGSTIEFVLRSYTNEYTPISAGIDSDGAMHSFNKEYHPTSVTKITQHLNTLSQPSITTPIYPFSDSHLDEILQAYNLDQPNTYNLLLYADSIRAAELNMLFQYYKIAAGTTQCLGLDIFCGDNVYNIKQWNKDYLHWNQMNPWELREWLSLFYVSWVQEWISSSDQVPDTFLKIKNTDVLFDTKRTVLQIINFCKLTLSRDLDPFIAEWSAKQQYIVDEFVQLDQVITHSITNQDFSWRPVSIIAEAIIQQRLRSNGYEIRCHGLNTFPTDSKMLYSLLEKC